jgi:hypothetical protein
VLVDGVLGSRNGSDVSLISLPEVVARPPGRVGPSPKKIVARVRETPATDANGGGTEGEWVRGSCAESSTDEAHGWTLRGRKHVGRLETVSGVLHRSDVRLARAGREAVLAERVNPRAQLEVARQVAFEAAVSRLEPVIRAREATKDARGRYLLVKRLLQLGGRHRVRGVSIRGPRRKPRDVQVSPAGRLPRICERDAPRARSTEAGEANSDAHLSRIPGHANGPGPGRLPHRTMMAASRML